MVYVQGYLLDRSVSVEVDSRPINSGIVSPSATSAMWGGMAVQVFPQQPYGAAVCLAQDVTQICAFTTFDRSDALISTAEDPVPSAGPRYAINYVNTGSGVKLVLQADPSLRKALGGAAANTQLSWDFQNQRAIAFSAAAGALPVRYVVGVVEDAWVVARNWYGGLRWEANAVAVVVVL